jgi:hypothetical protein
MSILEKDIHVILIILYNIEFGESSMLPLIEHIHTALDPVYAKKKEEHLADCQLAKLISAAALATSVAFAVFGIVLAVSGGPAAIVGLALILVSLPLGYLSYNAYRTSENAIDICNNPIEYLNFTRFDETFNKQTLKNKLTQGTFGFDLFTDLLIEKMVQRKIAR